jgi:hypothetical protein
MNHESPLQEATEKAMRETFEDLLANNGRAIAAELSAAVDGQLSVSLGFKLKRGKDAVGTATAMSYARRFKDTTECSAPMTDPNQPEFQEVVEDPQ